MIRRIALAALLAVAATGCAARSTAPPAPAAPPRDLAAVIDAIVDAPPVDRTHWGIAVFDPRTGNWLYRRNAERHFIPASNTKLTVTAAALGMLGEDWRYETRILAAGTDDAATVIVVASGDPTLSERFLGAPLAGPARLADSIAAAGIHGIAELVIDVTRFDDVAVHPAWEVGDLPWTYAPPVGAFAFDEGTFRLVLEPGVSSGKPASARQVGGDHQPVAARLITDTAGSSARWRVDYTARRDTVFLSGSIPAGAAPDTVRLAVTDPVAYAAHALAAALAERGIEVGSIRIVQDGVQSAGAARVVATFRSAPLRAIVAAILRPSQNWIAEQLLKTLGARDSAAGSWESGVGAESTWLIDQAGVDSAAFRLRDGSGLSAQNLLSPAAIVRILEHARTTPWRLAYRNALPAPGMPGSTLSNRLTGFEGRVRAKTGTISNVNSLSGYLLTDAGSELTFSIMTNGTGLPSAVVRRAMDDVVAAIAREAGR